MRQKSAGIIVLGVAGVAAVVGSGTASAFTVDPKPGAASVTLNQGEAAAVSSMNLGPALGQLAVPGWSPSGKAAVGDSIADATAVAAVTPGGWVRITVNGPLQMPTDVDVTRPHVETDR